MRPRLGLGIRLWIRLGLGLGLGFSSAGRTWYSENDTLAPACDALDTPPPPSCSRRPATSSPASRIGKSCAADVIVTAPIGLPGAAPGIFVAVTTT